MMASLVSTKPCMNNVIRCKAQVSSSPRIRSINSLLTKLPNSGGISLADLQVNEVVASQSRCSSADGRQQKRIELDAELLEDAYERCRCVCAEYAKTFYLGMEPNICLALSISVSRRLSCGPEADDSTFVFCLNI